MSAHADLGSCVSAYDLVVVGLGGMGSAVAAHAAMRGRVLGLERGALRHELGASAGRSRIIRKAYFEDVRYVPLLLRAYELWRELEAATATTLLDLIGVLMSGSHDSVTLAGVRASAARYDLPVEELSAADLRARYPGMRPLPGEVGLLERDAGVVFPERAVDAHLRLAHARGAELRPEAAVTGWERRPGGRLVVTLDDGSSVEAERLAVCAGPWSRSVLSDLDVPLRIQRNVQAWFAPASDAFARGRLPAFLLDRPGLPAPLYGFPDYGEGVKAALHGFGELTEPDSLDRSVSAQDVAAVQQPLEAWLPGAGSAFRTGKACMYALTPDEHFIIDRHPRDPGIAIACGFSGHGYKFCSVVGELVAQLAFDGGTALDIGFLGLSRFESARNGPGRNALEGSAANDSAPLSAS